MVTEFARCIHSSRIFKLQLVSLANDIEIGFTLALIILVTLQYSLVTKLECFFVTERIKLHLSHGLVLLQSERKFYNLTQFFLFRFDIPGRVRISEADPFRKHLTKLLEDSKVQLFHCHVLAHPEQTR